MFHSDIMSTMMQERARDLRASASNARDARVSRRARKFWAEEATRLDAVARRPRRHAHRAAGATGR